MRRRRERRRRRDWAGEKGRASSLGWVWAGLFLVFLNCTFFYTIMADETYILIFTPLPTHNDTGIIIANAINKIFTMTRSQILRRHTTYDKGKAVHIHSWHRQVDRCHRHQQQYQHHHHHIITYQKRRQRFGHYWNDIMFQQSSSSSLFKRSNRINDHWSTWRQTVGENPTRVSAHISMNQGIIWPGLGGLMQRVLLATYSL